MLRSENNPKVLSAIAEVVKNNREAAVEEKQKSISAAASRYNTFKLNQVKEDKQVELAEAELSPKQKKIAKLAGDPNKIDAQDLAKLRKEEKNTDTPGQHTCAVHVKNSTFGEGKTLFSQHAEPDEVGNIAWYDVMFEHGIERVDTVNLEILEASKHDNHKKA